MLADPHVGDVYRNEFYAGEAEDLAKVIELGGAIEVPAGTFAETLVTEDWTPLDATQKEHKTYAPGVGLVDERAVGESASPSPARRGAPALTDPDRQTPASAATRPEPMAATKAAWSRSVWSA